MVLFVCLRLGIFVLRGIISVSLFGFGFLVSHSFLELLRRQVCFALAIPLFFGCTIGWEYLEGLSGVVCHMSIGFLVQGFLAYGIL